MKGIYFDNGSTSFPKAPGVGRAMADYLENKGCNFGRGGYQQSYKVGEKVLETRQKIATLFNFTEGSEPSQNVVFTGNITGALNTVMKGFLKMGDHVLVSGLEHNAVIRPLHALEKLGVTYSVMPSDADGNLMVDEVEGLVLENTVGIVMTHCSNVTGTLLPIEKISQICKTHGLMFVVDSAQSAGVFPINMEATKIDALCFTGHKGLLGPQGIGGFIIGNEMNKKMNTCIEGGTGSSSESYGMPEFLPDKFESGTMNIPGIYGLSCALDYLSEIGIENIRKKEEELTREMLEGIKTVNGIELLGKKDGVNRSGVISVVSQKKDLSEIAFELDQQYGIMTRVGLHCAPLAHKTLGTFPEGTLRFSINHFNTKEEVWIVLEALKKIVS
ncbi:MAG: aminotransferase class V-fold PLP-dependent enzyme [Eubacteriaceae bacterium]